MRREFEKTSDARKNDVWTRILTAEIGKRLAKRGNLEDPFRWPNHPQFIKKTFLESIIAFVGSDEEVKGGSDVYEMRVHMNEKKSVKFTPNWPLSSNEWRLQNHTVRYGQITNILWRSKKTLIIDENKPIMFCMRSKRYSTKLFRRYHVDYFSYLDFANSMAYIMKNAW